MLKNKTGICKRSDVKLITRNKAKRMEKPRPTKRKRSALEEDVAAVDAASLASARLNDARQISQQSLDLCRLTKPYDFAFLQKCMLSAPRLQHSMRDDQNQCVHISRGYEERFLIEQPHRQPCRMGSECEGLRLKGDCEPFVLPEFLLPDEKPTSERKCCLLCLRKQAAEIFYASLAEPFEIDLQGPLLPFCNIVGVPGEYRIEDTLVAHQRSIVSHLPVIKHMRSAYKIERIGGQRRVVQTLYLKPDEVDSEHDSAFFRRGASESTHCSH